MSTTLHRRVTTENIAACTFSGGSTAAPVLNDESASTWVGGPASAGVSWMFLNFDPAVIPDGAQITAMTVMAQMTGTGGLARFYLQAPTTAGFTQTLTTNTKPTATLTNFQWTKTAGVKGPFTSSDVNNMCVQVNLDVGVRLTRLEVLTVFNERPVVTVASIDGTLLAPTFTTSSQRPRIWWLWSDPDNDKQERYQVAIYRDEVVTAPGFVPGGTNAAYDSGVVYAGGQSHVVDTSLVAGPYWAYVRASDVGSNGRYSNWARASFTVAPSPPDVPTLVSATADNVNGYNVITVQQSDNLLSYTQAGYESATDGFAWYKDTNVTTLAVSTTAATNAEGSNVLAQTATAASISKIRSGGAWTSLGIGGVTFISRESDLLPKGVNDYCPTTGTNLTTASFPTTNGSVLVASVAFKTAPNADPTATVTVTSSPSLTWTKRVESKFSVDGRTGYTALFTATATGVATTISVSGGTQGKGRSLLGMKYVGVNAASPVGATAHGAQYKGLATSYVSTSTGSLGVAATIDDSAGTLAVANGINVVERHQKSTYTALHVCRSSNTSASGTTVATTETGGAGDVSFSVIELMPSATPPTGVPSDLLAAVPAQPNTAYTVSAACWVANVANTVKNFRVDVEWYDSTGTIISTTAGTSTSTVGGNLLASYTANVTSPALTASAVLVGVAIAPAAGEVYHWDRYGLLLGSDQNWTRGGMQSLNLLDVYAGSQEGNHIGGWVKTPGTGYATTTLVALADANVKSGYTLELYGSNSAYAPVAQSEIVLGAVPGQSYTFSTMALTVANNTNGYVAIQFCDANGIVVGQASSSAYSLGATKWQVLVVTGVCPAGATGARAVISSDYVAVGSATKWTRHAISPGSTVPTAWQPGPMPAAYPLVEGSDDGGVTWVKVRGCESDTYSPTNAWQATVIDYEAPSNTARMYRAKTAGVDYGINPVGFYVVSAPSDIVTATLTVRDFYLVDSYIPTRFFMEQEGQIDVTTAEPQALFSPLGRSTEVITYDVHKSKHFTFKLGMLAGAELDIFEAMRASGHVLFLQTPYPRSWYVKIGPTQKTTWLISPDVTGRFDVDVDLIEVARPD